MRKTVLCLIAMVLCAGQTCAPQPAPPDNPQPDPVLPVDPGPGDTTDPGGSSDPPAGGGDQLVPDDEDQTPVSDGAVVIFDNGRGKPWPSGARLTPIIRLEQPHRITQLRTFHWNEGRGIDVPGTLALRDQDGVLFGPWQVQLRTAIDVYGSLWHCDPDMVLPAGSYTVFDSQVSTWTYVPDTEVGFVRMMGVPLTTASTGNSVSQVMSPANAPQTLSYGDAVTLTIPGGELDDKHYVSITRTDTAPAFPLAYLVQGATYDISVGGREVFDQPLTISFAYDAAKVPAGLTPAQAMHVFFWDKDHEQWAEQPATVDTATGRVIVETTHLCNGKLTYAPNAGGTDTSLANFIIETDPALVGYSQQFHFPGRGNLGFADYHAWVKQQLQAAWALYQGAGFTMPAKPVTVRFTDDRESYYSPYRGFIHIAWRSYNEEGQEAAAHEIAHELFHAVQNQYLSVIQMNWEVVRWFIEASADYASDAVVGHAGFMGKTIQPEYLETRYNRVNGKHEYHTAHFVDYLTARTDFLAMWNAIAAGSASRAQLILDLEGRLSAYLDGATSKTLAEHFADFALFYLFDSASPRPRVAALSELAEQVDELDLGTSPTVTSKFLAPTRTAWLNAVLVDIDQNKPRMIELTPTGLEPGVHLYVKVSKGLRAAGSIIELTDAGAQIEMVSDDERMYLVLVNTLNGQVAVDVTVREANSLLAKLKRSTYVGADLRIQDPRAVTWKTSGCTPADFEGHVRTNGTFAPSFETDVELAWTGNAFTAVQDRDYGATRITITGELSADGKRLLTLSAKRETTNYQERTNTYELTVNNLPMVELTEYSDSVIVDYQVCNTGGDPVAGHVDTIKAHVISSFTDCTCDDFVGLDYTTVCLFVRFQARE